MNIRAQRYPKLNMAIAFFTVAYFFHVRGFNTLLFYIMIDGCVENEYTSALLLGS
jgi:hypothetical protein